MTANDLLIFSGTIALPQCSQLRDSLMNIM